MYEYIPSSCSHPPPYQTSASNPPFALRQLINRATEGLVSASNEPSCLLQPNHRSLSPTPTFSWLNPPPCRPLVPPLHLRSWSNNWCVFTLILCSSSTLPSVPNPKWPTLYFTDQGQIPLRPTGLGPILPSYHTPLIVQPMVQSIRMVHR